MNAKAKYTCSLYRVSGLTSFCWDVNVTACITGVELFRAEGAEVGCNSKADQTDRYINRQWSTAKHCNIHCQFVGAISNYLKGAIWCAPTASVTSKREIESARSMVTSKLFSQFTPLQLNTVSKAQAWANSGIYIKCKHCLSALQIVLSGIVPKVLNTDTCNNQR